MASYTQNPARREKTLSRQESRSRGGRRCLVKLAWGWSVIVAGWICAPGNVDALVGSKSTSPSSKFSTMGKAIQEQLDSVEEGLVLASQFWLPTDEDLPPHYTQLVHHETRQRWASQLLTKVAATLLEASTNLPSQELLEEERLARLIRAAAMPHATTEDRLEKEGKWIVESLQAIYALVGRSDVGTRSGVVTTAPALEGIRQLMGRARGLGGVLSMDQACRAHWAIEGIKVRLSGLDWEEDQVPLSKDQLRARVEALPFRIVPLGVDWTRFLSKHDRHGGPRTQEERSDAQPEYLSTDRVCNELLAAIPFSRDTIVTRAGNSVIERRGTAWIAEQGIGALAYSGKLMEPHPIPALVQYAMREVEERLDLVQSTAESSGRPNSFFDCALCNHYADAGSACKFHTDPEHGLMWDRTTVVVAAGSDRVFAFKPIDTPWSDWDSSDNAALIGTQGGVQAAATHLFAGDLVVMTDNCNDDFYHAVHAGETDAARVSLVFKRGIGQRGHGLAGQGRRSRRKRHPQQQPRKNLEREQQRRRRRR